MTFVKNLAVIILGMVMSAQIAFASDVPVTNFEALMNPAFVTDSVPTLSVYSKYIPKKGETVFNESSIAVSAIDPTIGSNKTGSHLPGARGANQLIIYTSKYGERTGTNEFGAEAIVEGNNVTELSGADSVIPFHGVVISGHGTAKSWIVKNIKVGTKVYFDSATNTLYAYTTSESYHYEAQRKIDEAKAMLDYYKMKNSSYDFKVPNYYIKEATDYMKKADKDAESIKKFSQYAIESANRALKSVVPYENAEFKGVWVRPLETSANDIEKSVKRIKASGIDNIFLETYYHGRTIFPSKTMENYGFVKQNEKFVGMDPLKLWIKYAHRHNIRVHVWFESFYVGIQRPEANPGNILAVKPDWANKTKKNYNMPIPTPSAAEHNGFFIDPANPEVQIFLLTLLEEILTEYKVDGINLDYIRYPHAIAIKDENSWGYTKTAREEFKNIYGKDPVNISISDNLWVKWCEYRRDKISNFVARVGALAREKHTYLTAVIFPDRLTALTTKQQDWKTWSTRGYVNGFTPLFLTCNAKTLNALVTNVIKAKSEQTDLYAGLFVTFMGGSEEDLIREIHETRKIDVNGVILFDYAHLDDKYINALATRVFNEKQPDMSTIAKVQGPVKLRRVDGSPQNVETSKQPTDKKVLKEKKRKKAKKEKKRRFRRD